MTVRKHLYLMTLFVCFLLFLTSSLELYKSHRIHESRKEAVAFADLSRKVQVNLGSLVRDWKNMLLHGHNREDFERYRNSFFRQRDMVERDLLRLQEVSEFHGANIGKIRNAVSRMSSKLEDALVEYDPSDPSRTDRKVIDIDWYTMSEMDQVVANVTMWRNQEQEKTIDRAYLATLALGFLGMLFCLFATIPVSRKILDSLRKMEGHFERIGRGDLSVEIWTDGKDEFAQLTRSLGKMQDRLRKSVEESGAIFETVEEGLFLVGPELRTGKRHSKALRSILGHEEPGDREFLDLVPGLPAETLEATKIFLELMFLGSHDEELLTSLNPLREIETDGKFMQFRFRRIHDSGRVILLLGVAYDITEKTLLKRGLEREMRKSHTRQKILRDIISCNPSGLSEFMDDLREAQEAVRAELTFAETPDQERRILARFLHGLKGDSAATGLLFFEKTVHELEDELKGAAEVRKVSGPILSRMDEVEGEIMSLIRKLGMFQQTFQAGPVETNRSIVRALENLIRRRRREVEFRHDRFRIDGLPPETRRLVKGALIQFARNSLSHGLEGEKERLERGKGAAPTIELRGERVGDEYVIVFRDDGRGLNPERVREKAAELGLETEGMSDEEAALLIFEPGLSTSERADGLSGRGVGMDLVRENIRRAGGGVRVRSSPGEFCEFTIAIPAV